MRVKWHELAFSGNMNSTKLIVGAVVLILAIGVSALFLRPSMPTMTDQGNEAATALLSATNRKDEKAVLAVEVQIQAWVNDGSLSKSDEKVLMGIIGLAKAKDWEKANAKVRALKEAQIVEQP